MIVHSLISFNIIDWIFEVNNLINSKKYKIKKDLFIDLWINKKSLEKIKINYWEDILLFLKNNKFLKNNEEKHRIHFDNWFEKSWLPSISFHSMWRNIVTQDFLSDDMKNNIREQRIKELKKIENKIIINKTNKRVKINQNKDIKELKYSINYALKKRQTTREFSWKNINKKSFYSIFKNVFDEINKHKSWRNIIIESSNSFFEYFVFINNVEWFKKWIYKFDDINLEYELVKDNIKIEDIIRLWIWQKAFKNTNFVFIPVLKAKEYLILYNNEKCLRNSYIDLWAIWHQMIIWSECEWLSSFITPAIKDEIWKELLWEKYDWINNILGYLVWIWIPLK